MRKTKRIIGLIAIMMMIGILSPMTAMAVSGKPIAVALCMLNQTTGVCKSDTNFLKLPLDPQYSPPENCELVKSALDNAGLTGTILFVTMGDTAPTLINYDCLEVSFDLIGRVNTKTNNDTHMETDSLESTTNENTITYENTQPIAYSELGFEYELKNITYWNGTANITEEKNVSYIKEFFTITSTEIGIDSTNVPTANADATLEWNGITREPTAIYKDGILCDLAECTNRVYDANADAYSFDVDSFSTFTLGFTYNEGDLVPVLSDGTVKAIRGIGSIAIIMGLIIAVGIGIAVMRIARK